MLVGMHRLQIGRQLLGGGGVVALGVVATRQIGAQHGGILPADIRQNIGLFQILC